MNALSIEEGRVITRVPMLIGNADHAGQGETIQVINPATEELLAEFPGASVTQVEEAVNAANAALKSGVWADAQFRRGAMLKLADIIERNADVLMDLLVGEIGTPVNLKHNHINVPVAYLRWYANAATEDRTRNLGLHPNGNAFGLIAYRPVGVVAAISAFNFPVFIAIAKAGAAWAAGCTTVVLSSPLAPLAIAKLGDMVREAGFPAGVVNIVAGGADAGRALTESKGVAKVTFTGSVNVGLQVMQQAAKGLRGVVLELGGKSPAILLPGTDYRKHAAALHARYARNAGQGCGSPTRILVPEADYAAFVEISRDVYPQLKVGDPRDPSTVLGPVVTAGQRERIEAVVQQAVSEGGEIVAGGGRPDIGKGWFLNPVLIGGQDNRSSLAQNEIFGPVSTVITYRSVEEAIAIANDSELGLKAYVFGPTAECLKVAPQLEVGTVQINGGSPQRPDGAIIGWKLSGVGSEWGEDGIREFLRPQYIDVPL